MKMTPQEARQVAQEVSLVLELAYGSRRARLILGFWASALWPSEVRKISAGGLAICVHGKESVKLAAYLAAVTRNAVAIYGKADLVSSYKRTHTMYLNRSMPNSVSINLGNNTYDPWPKLKLLSEQFSAACDVLRGHKRLFGDAYAKTVIETLSETSSRTLYRDVVLCWAGWGALCLASGYREDVFPIPEPLGTESNRELPDFDGICAYRHDWMILLAKCAGKDVRKLAPPREVASYWARPSSGSLISVCELFLSKKTEWVFKLADALELEFKPTPGKPRIYVR